MQLITVTALVALLIIPIPASAEGFSFGLLGGLSQSQFDFTSSASYITVGDPETRPGYRVGFFAEHSLYGPVYLHLGLDYKEQGWEVRQVESQDDTRQNDGFELGHGPVDFDEFDPFLRYMEIPLMLKVRPDLGKVSPFAMAGPRLDIRVGQSNDPEWDGRYRDFRRTQWGMTFGGGAEVTMTQGLSAVFAVTYSFDFEGAYEADVNDEWSMTIDRSSVNFVTGVRF